MRRAADTRRILDAIRDAGVPIDPLRGRPARICSASWRPTAPTSIGIDCAARSTRRGDRRGAARSTRAIQGNLDPARLLAGRDADRGRRGRRPRAVGGRPGHVFNLGHAVATRRGPGRAPRSSSTYRPRPNGTHRRDAQPNHAGRDRSSRACLTGCPADDLRLAVVARRRAALHDRGPRRPRARAASSSPSSGAATRSSAARRSIPVTEAQAAALEAASRRARRSSAPAMRFSRADASRTAARASSRPTASSGRGDRPLAAVLAAADGRLRARDRRGARGDRRRRRPVVAVAGRLASASPTSSAPSLDGSATALARASGDERRRVPVLLTAHSLPRRVAEQEPAYLAQLQATAPSSSRRPPA